MSHEVREPIQPDLLPVSASEFYRRPKGTRASGIERKAAGLDLVVANERQEWLDRALYLLRVYVSRLEVGSFFAFDDIRAFYDACGLAQPHHPNVYGAVLRMGASEGVPIAKTDRTRPAHHPQAHHRLLVLWTKTTPEMRKPESAPPTQAL